MGSLKSSMILMCAIEKNASMSSIDAIFNGDAHLVDMLCSYLLHNQCIERSATSNNGWVVLAQGRNWLSLYGEKAVIL